MLVLELLKWAACGPPYTSAERIASMLAEGRDRELRWVMDAGLGPMLYFAVQDHFERVPAAWRDVLLSSDLTAQVRHAAVIDTANQVIDACTELGIPLTLLKGISISDQYYPAGHLRPMGDIDILVPSEACDAVESALLRIGYRPDATHPRNGDMHHLPPLLEPERKVWVELHTSLFPRYEELSKANLFASSPVFMAPISVFQTRSVRRFTDELQLAYIASSWMRDLTLSGVQPCFLASLFDAVYLLKASAIRLDWNKLLSSLDDDTAAASLYVTLGFISRHGLCTVPREAFSFLRANQRLVGRLQIRAIHAMLNNCLVGGRFWTLPLPPPVPGRYNLRNQLHKRWLGRLPILRRPT